MSEQNARLGAMIMVAVTLIFAIQDALSRHLAGHYNTFMIVMIRYWFFAAFVVILALRQSGGLRSVIRSEQPWLQLLRGVLLLAEICVMVFAFVLLGLVETHAVFVCYPLIVTLLSGPVLGEKVGWKRWAAIGVGFIGVLVLLQPGSGVFRIEAVVPLIAATLFAVYGLLTRLVSRHDRSSTSFFYTGVFGALLATPIGLWNWEPMSRADWGWMLALSLIAILGHWLLIKCYELAEASSLQPFAYLQLPFAAGLGVVMFGEALRLNVVAGAAIVVAAGLFTFWREHVKRASG